MAYCGNNIMLPINYRDATGKFPDYPDMDEGGSLAIFKKREEPVSAVTLLVSCT